MDAQTGAITYLLKFSWSKNLGPERHSNDNSLVVECEVNKGILDAKAFEKFRVIIELYRDVLLEDKFNPV